MKKKAFPRKKDKISLAIAALIAIDALALAGMAGRGFAWFAEHNRQADIDGISGSSTVDYFNGGDGSKDDPFQIAYPFQLYNFAWLQDLGYFNEKIPDGTGNPTDKIKQYHFKLQLPAGEVSHTLDMASYLQGKALPPIGSSSFPFVGSFDGNGVTIENLIISNRYADLLSPPTDRQGNSLQESDGTLKDSKYVGTFGVVGQVGPADSSSLPYDKEQAIVKDLYLDELRVSAAGTDALAGLLVGYAGATMERVGVHYSSLKVASGLTSTASFKAVSGYALLGDYAPNYKWVDAPGEGGYGRNFDIHNLYTRMGSILGNVNSIEKGQFLPFVGTGTKVEDGNGHVIGEEADDRSIGYFIGNDIKGYNSERRFYPHFLVPTSTPGQVLTKEIPPEDDVYRSTFGAIDLTTTATVPVLRLQAKLDINRNKVTIPSAKLSGQRYASAIAPRRSVWIKPSLAGLLRFVMVNPGNGENFTLSKAKRAIFGDLTSRHVNLTSLLDTKDIHPLANASAITSIDGVPASLSGYNAVAYYFEHEITQQDIAEGYEFFLSRDNGSSGAYFWYMDLGQNGGSANYEGQLSHLDFLTKENGAVTRFDSSSYSPSKVGFKLTGSATAEASFYFRRDLSHGVLHHFAPHGLVSDKLGKGKATVAADASCLSP